MLEGSRDSKRRDHAAEIRDPACQYEFTLSSNPSNRFIGERIESCDRLLEVLFFRVLDLVVADAVQAAK